MVLYNCRKDKGKGEIKMNKVHLKISDARMNDDCSVPFGNATDGIFPAIHDYLAKQGVTLNDDQLDQLEGSVQSSDYKVSKLDVDHWFDQWIVKGEIDFSIDFLGQKFIITSEIDEYWTDDDKMDDIPFQEAYYNVIKGYIQDCWKNRSDLMNYVVYGKVSDYLDEDKMGDVNTCMTSDFDIAYMDSFWVDPGQDPKVAFDIYMQHVSHNDLAAENMYIFLTENYDTFKPVDFAKGGLI